MAYSDVYRRQVALLIKTLLLQFKELNLHDYHEAAHHSSILNK